MRVCGCVCVGEVAVIKDSSNFCKLCNRPVLLDKGCVCVCACCFFPTRVRKLENPQTCINQFSQVIKKLENNSWSAELISSAGGS